LNDETHTYRTGIWHEDTSIKKYCMFGEFLGEGQKELHPGESIVKK